MACINALDPAHPKKYARDGGGMDTFAVMAATVATTLAPVFVEAAKGDIGLAQATAEAAVNGYNPCSEGDVLTAAQIVGLGFATLGSLCVSMQEDIPLATALRLRGCANALSRSESRSRAARKDNARDAEASLSANKHRDAESDAAKAGTKVCLQVAASAAASAPPAAELPGPTEPRNRLSPPAGTSFELTADEHRLIQLALSVGQAAKPEMHVLRRPAKRPPLSTQLLAGVAYGALTGSAAGEALSIGATPRLNGAVKALP